MTETVKQKRECAIPRPLKDQIQTSRQETLGSGAVSDDTKYKVSPDCLVHGGFLGQVAKELDDAHAVSLCSDIGRTDVRLLIARADDSAPTGQPLVSQTGADSLGSDRRQNGVSAIGRNSGTHKTGRVPATSPPYTASGKNAAHTGYRLAEHQSGELRHDKNENKILRGDLPSHLSVQTSCDTAGISSYYRSFYKEFTSHTSHFAVFPRKLEPRSKWIGIELSEEYAEIARKRTSQQGML